MAKCLHTKCDRSFHAQGKQSTSETFSGERFQRLCLHVVRAQVDMLPEIFVRYDHLPSPTNSVTNNTTMHVTVGV